MNRRLVIAGVATAALGGAVVPALAQSGSATSPVTVYTDTHDGVSAGFYVNGQPGAGAHVSPDGQVCVGISLQLPVCADAGSVTDKVNQSVSVGSLPVTVTHDTSNGVSAGVDFGSQPGVHASVTPDGTACVSFSEELPACVGGIGPSGQTRQSLPLPPVVVYQDDNGTTVGVGDVGVRAGNDGRICPLVSTQTWQCVGGDG